jgi:hypothetical protein
MASLLSSFSLPNIIVQQRAITAERPDRVIWRSKNMGHIWTIKLGGHCLSSQVLLEDLSDHSLGSVAIAELIESDIITNLIHATTHLRTVSSLAMASVMHQAYST